tara:strand:+ start:439 stop:939 length:501 start_codon:yes stop_codon:yes gene_type:complete
MAKVSEFEPALKGPPSYKVHWDIVLLARKITKTFDHIFSEFNLNLTDVALISLIDLNDSLTQSQLAKSLGIGKARLGIVIKNLEQKNILERSPNSYDHRSWQIKFTQEGELIRKKLGEKHSFLKEISAEFVDLESYQGLSEYLNEFRMDLSTLLDRIEESNSEQVT